MRIEGAAVFVTGANRGLGRAFARQALALGAAKVYAGMRDPAGFGGPGSSETRLVPVRIDVTDSASVQRAAAEAGDTTVLVNNAGVGAVVPGPLDARMGEVTRAMMEVNLYGTMRVTETFAPVLGRAPRSAILNVLSIVSWAPSEVLAAYAVSKTAAWSYTNHVREALRAQNTAVAGLHVGFLDTDMARNVDAPKSDPDDVARQALEALAAGRSEVLADEATRALKASLSADEPGYMRPFGQAA